MRERVDTLEKEGRIRLLQVNCLYIKDDRAIKMSGLKIILPGLLKSYLSNFSVNFAWMILVS